jgi:ribosome-binding factor A
MEFDKHEKVRSVLTEVIAAFIREEANHNPLITVTNLVIASDYRHVKVLFTTIPDTGEAASLIFLKRKGSELREYIKKNARLKYIPHIDFEIDYGERHRQHIDDLVQDIEKGK